MNSVLQDDNLKKNEKWQFSIQVSVQVGNNRQGQDEIIAIQILVNVDCFLRCAQMERNELQIQIKNDNFESLMKIEF